MEFYQRTGPNTGVSAGPIGAFIGLVGAVIIWTIAALVLLAVVLFTLVVAGYRRLVR